jgi:hypothetical protein
MLVDAQVTVVVLEPAKHRELAVADMIALNKWTHLELRLFSARLSCGRTYIR